MPLENKLNNRKVVIMFEKIDKEKFIEYIQTELELSLRILF